MTGRRTPCPVCGIIFPTKTAAIEHRKDEHGDLSNQKHCEKCNRYFASENQLQIHIRYSRAHNQCPDCGKNLPAMHMPKHRAEQHQYCQPCNVYYDTAAAFTEHQDPQEPMREECPDYGQGLHSLHERTAHLNNGECPKGNGDDNFDPSDIKSTKTYTCPSCDRVFVGVIALLDHVEDNRACLDTMDPSKPISGVLRKLYFLTD